MTLSQDKLNYLTSKLSDIGRQLDRLPDEADGYGSANKEALAQFCAEVKRLSAKANHRAIAIEKALAD